MSKTNPLSLSIVVEQPVWGSDVDQDITEIVSDQINDYGHELAADGGYISADFQINDNQANIEAWLERLGYDVTAYSDGLDEVFNGFVNEVEVSLGGVTLRVGPLLEISNKVAVTYKTVTYNTNHPVGGVQTTSSYASDTTSQTRYSVLEQIVSGGEGTATEMEQLRDTLLAEMAIPITTQDLNVGRPAEPSVKVSVRGYRDLLDRFFYSNSASGTVNLSAKIVDILGDSPTVTFNTDRIDTNPLQVPNYAEGEKTGLGMIRDIVAKGDASDNRYTFGIYAGQAAVYEQIPSTVYYTHALGDAEQVIALEGTGSRVYPWNVKPGRWLMVTDFLVGRGAPATVEELRKDPRAIFIESVRYSAPWGISINGGRVGKLNQKLAKLGLGGI